MSKVDWSLAPEGATHYSSGNSSRSTYPAWWRPSVEVSDKYECWAIGTSFGCETWQKGPFHLPSIAVKREWSGPEDGLPPINQEVLFKVKGRHQGFGFVSFYGEEFCVIRNTTPDGGPTEQVCMIDEFSAIQTRSAYEATTARETAIRELMDIAQVDCRVTAARLVDAGFKR